MGRWVPTTTRSTDANARDACAVVQLTLTKPRGLPRNPWLPVWWGLSASTIVFEGEGGCGRGADVSVGVALVGVVCLYGCSCGTAELGRRVAFARFGTHSRMGPRRCNTPHPYAARKRRSRKERRSPKRRKRSVALLYRVLLWCLGLGLGSGSGLGLLKPPPPQRPLQCSVGCTTHLLVLGISIERGCGWCGAGALCVMWARAHVYTPCSTFSQPRLSTVLPGKQQVSVGSCDPVP